MRTTLDLPDETFRQLKARAALSGLKLKDLVTQFIEQGLATREVTQPAAPRAPRPPIPIARKADGSVTPALSNAELYAILDQEDLEQYQRALGRNGAAE